MYTLLSSVRVIAGHALLGVRHNLHFHGLLRNGLRNWINVFDPRIRENRRANFLRPARRRPPDQHRRNSEGPHPNRLGQHSFEICHGEYPSLFLSFCGFDRPMPPALNAPAS
jgi:hypothetical protein